jgi:predicted PurR-regulated permease PerM
VQFIGVFDVWYSQRQQPKIAAAVLYSSVLVLILLSMTLGLLYIPLLGLAVLLSASLLCFIIAWKVRSQRNFIMSLYLVASFLFAVVFPSVFLIRNCVQESITLTTKINDYLQTNENMQQIMNEGLDQSAIYHKIVDYAATWGISRAELTPVAIKARLASGISSLTNNVSVFFGTSYNVITNITNTLVSLLIFLSALFYIVSYKDVLAKEIIEVSPFTEKEQLKLGSSMKNSVSRIFICSLITGLIHFTATFASFALLGLELKYIAAMISAFLAIIPVLSTWIIWVPVTGWLLFSGDILRGTILAAVHILASYVLDPQVFAFIPGNPYYAGMSVFFGISAFGPIGALTGPLLAGILVTTMDIYKSFYASRASQKLDDNSKQRIAHLHKVSTEVKRIQQIDERLHLAQ